MPMIRGRIGEVFAGHRIIHSRVNDRVMEHDSELRGNREPGISDSHIAFDSDPMIVMGRAPIAGYIKQTASLQVHGVHVGNGPLHRSRAIERRDWIGTGFNALRNQTKAKINGHELKLV